MQAHRVRRHLWGLDLLLAVAVAAGGWWVADARAAVAQAPQPDAQGRVPSAWRSRDAAFSDALRAVRSDILRPAVDEATLKAHASRQDKGLEEPHFPLSGPWPVPQQAPRPDNPAPPTPEGLAREGRILRFSGYGEGSPRTTLVWVFSEDPTRKHWFQMGEWVRRGPDAPRRYRLESARRTAPGRYEVRYTIHDPEAPASATRAAVLIHEDAAMVEPGAASHILRPVDPASSVTSSTIEATGTPRDASRPGTRRVTRLQDLGVQTHRSPSGRSHVTLDDASLSFLRTRGAAQVLEAVKLQPRTLPGGLGAVEIRHLGDLPADRLLLRVGDAIVRVGGRATATREALVEAVQAIDPTTSRVAVEVDRSGRRLVFQVDPRDNDTRRRAAQAVARDAR